MRGRTGSVAAGDLGVFNGTPVKWENRDLGNLAEFFPYEHFNAL